MAQEGKLRPLNSLSNENETLAFAQALPKEWSEKDLRKYFDPKNENIVSVTIVKNRLGQNTGKAMIRFRSKKVCL